MFNRHTKSVERHASGPRSCQVDLGYKERPQAQVHRRRAQLVTGRVLQFDHSRGYGFVAPDDGGEDVFLHASVFDGDPDELVPGTKVEFKVMAGDRGQKAFAAHLIDDEPENDLVPPPRPVSPPQSVPELRPGPASPPVWSYGPTPLPPPAQTSAAPAPHAPGKDQAPDDEQECDVLRPAEFEQELTEMLLSNIPSLTGRQVLEVRQTVLESAKKHGWVDM
jgi:CspA family cold shock protein